MDEAESGRIADRPQFRRMIDEGGRNNASFQVILVWKFSRLTRKREHAVTFKSMLRRKGIRVVSIIEHADDSATGKLIEAVIESVDAFTSENPAEEVKQRGMREAAFRGYFLASKALPFGYMHIKMKAYPSVVPIFRGLPSPLREKPRAFPATVPDCRVLPTLTAFFPSRSPGLIWR